jgi:hypothetical protein
VAVQSGLGDDDPDFSGGLGRHYSVMHSHDGDLTVVEPEVSTVSKAVCRDENE